MIHFNKPKPLCNPLDYTTMTKYIRNHGHYKSYKRYLYVKVSNWKQAIVLLGIVRDYYSTEQLDMQFTKDIPDFTYRDKDYLDVLVNYLCYNRNIVSICYFTDGWENMQHFFISEMMTEEDAINNGLPIMDFEDVLEYCGDSCVKNFTWDCINVQFTNNQEHNKIMEFMTNERMKYMENRLITLQKNYTQLENLMGYTKDANKLNITLFTTDEEDSMSVTNPKDMEVVLEAVKKVIYNNLTGITKEQESLITERSELLKNKCKEWL